MEREKAGAWAGVLSGVGLALEAAFFMASGWSADAFSTLEGAAAVLRDGGELLRWAVVFGAFNLVLLTLLFVGLAEHVGRNSPALGATVLYLGIVGIAIHALVPIGFYQAVPAFQSVAGTPGADASWRAFKLILDSAQSAGSLFMGLAMLAAGLAALTGRLMSNALGILALLAGITGVVMSFASGTALAAMAGGLAVTSIILSIVFRVWSGLALWKAAASAA